MPNPFRTAARARPRRATLALLLAAATGALVPARRAAAQSPATQSPGARAFTPVGAYRLGLIVGSDTVHFFVTVVDSAGRLTGEFVGASGARRPLVRVGAAPDSQTVTATYRDGAGVAVMTLRLRGDAVRGESEYGDGTFAVYGTREPLPAPARGSAPAGAAKPPA